MKYSNIITYVFLLGLLMNNGCSSSSKEVDEETSNEQAELSKIDRIKLVDLDGKQINLADFKGKRVFLNLWATWCKPCIAEMPDLSEASEILSNENYVFLAASDEKLDKIKKFISKYDYHFQFVKMENSIYDLDVVALPTSFIINAKGEIVYDEVGAKNWASEEVLADLRKY